MIKNLIYTIIHDLWTEECNLIVVRNPDGFLFRDDVQNDLRCRSIIISEGTSLDLRIFYELQVKKNEEYRFLFIANQDFDIMEDIREKIEYFNFSISKYFRAYHWLTIKDLPLTTLNWLFRQNQHIPLSELATSNLLQEYNESSDAKNEHLKELIQQFDEIVEEVNFHQPTESMNEISRIMLEIIRLERWKEMQERVFNLNQRFQSFLCKSYSNICSSTVGKSPKVVTQILPFLERKKNTKVALLVIDGMNYWQSILLKEAILEQKNTFVDTECIYSWLPSTTEFSRQAIFKGRAPSADYDQNPKSESKLWNSFWNSNNIPSYKQSYTHDSELIYNLSHEIVAYVSTDLDEKMHSSSNYYDLYDLTENWVQHSDILQIISKLIGDGFSVFITTDHGNVESTPYRSLNQYSKLCANFSLRHITLPPGADRTVFLEEHGGNLLQINMNTNTFYMKDSKIFSSKAGIVTHGGTNFQEVLIPFMTVTKK